ncbi:E3 ubiquitin-protein ligase arih1 [Exaiptasia diaphana]|uniref:RBR-type E3 ubiquitin transferase n=1 Tax=Exaiptasia diaphana TaxID=2652724 RepID=A0A913X3U8_EXADI|nr:E3 ubiquitin-protein ligase arih1 [Exaiptasia diaphana]
MDSGDEDVLYEEDQDDSADESPSEEAENSDFDIDCEDPSTPKRPHLNDDFHYECLTPEALVSYMNEIIDEVNSVFQLPRATARILLSHFKWDREKLLERYYSGNQESLFTEAHIVFPSKTSHSSRANTRSQPSELLCEICLSLIPASTFTGLECSHKFCPRCWKEYLTTKIIDEHMGENISCPASKCDILVDEAFVGQIVRDPKVKTQYHHVIANSFVVNNRLMKWCPGPDCHNAIKANYHDALPVTCLCGYTFCFGCSEPVHEPVKCLWLKKWIKKTNDDSETSNWISANTKECPKCNVTIEKNGGCNHMVCRNNNCKADFCWVCLGPWEPHGSSWYSCNRYDEKEAQSARDSQSRSRAALERYLFYCNRYMNHAQSAKFESKLYAQVKQKMEEMQQHNMSWIEVQFLRKAVDVLCQCRNTLKYTYVFAFYLKKNNQSVIFEDNQKDLEMATETLSEYLERDITQESLGEIKQKVQDKYRYCEARRKALLDHVYEGYDTDIWEYKDYD